MVDTISYTVNITPPRSTENAYVNFVNQRGGTGNSDDPSVFESRLPEGYVRSGFARFNSTITAVGYDLENRPASFAGEEIRSIFDAAWELGAVAIDIRRWIQK
jgi:hypothetical protein